MGVECRETRPGRWEPKFCGIHEKEGGVVKATFPQRAPPVPVPIHCFWPRGKKGFLSPQEDVLLVQKYVSY